MTFAGKVWKLLVGIKDGLVLLLMMFFFASLYAALSTSPYKDSARRGALHLDLGGAIVEQPAAPDPFDALAGGAALREYRLSELVHALDTAAEDDRIEAVALDLDVFAGGGQSAIANVGAALDRVRRSGKRVVAYATGYGDDSYQLAAHADEIWLDPLGAVLIAGPGGPNLYYAGLLERLGVTANVYRVGTYKSAVEPYTRNDMSPEARQATQALADSLWETWQQDVRQARPQARIGPYAQDPARFIAAAGGDMARAALAAGLVDRIGDRNAFGRRMAELAGTLHERVPGSYRAVRYEAWADEHPVGEDDGCNPECDDALYDDDCDCPAEVIAACGGADFAVLAADPLPDRVILWTRVTPPATMSRTTPTAARASPSPWTRLRRSPSRTTPSSTIMSGVMK